MVLHRPIEFTGHIVHLTRQNPFVRVDDFADMWIIRSRRIVSYGRTMTFPTIPRLSCNTHM
jgi:hypothetical protein